MGKADSLSRRPDQEVGVEKDNEDEMLVKPKWLEVRKTEAVEIIVDGVDLLEKVRKSKVKNDKVVKVVEEMKRAGVKMLRDKEQREIDSICKGDRSKAPGDSSVNYNLWNIVTTYLQEIPQRIR